MIQVGLMDANFKQLKKELVLAESAVEGIKDANDRAFRVDKVNALRIELQKAKANLEEFKKLPLEEKVAYQRRLAMGDE